MSEIDKLRAENKELHEALDETNAALVAEVDRRESIERENEVLRAQNYEMNKRIVGLASPATAADLPDVVLPEFDSLSFAKDSAATQDTCAYPTCGCPLGVIPGCCARGLQQPAPAADPAPVIDASALRNGQGWEFFPDGSVRALLPSRWCEHVGGLGPPFPFCKICADKEQPTSGAGASHHPGFGAGASGATPRTDVVLPLGSGRDWTVPHIALELAGLSRSLERELSSTNARADALQAARDAAVADAKLGQILMRYIDRLTDLTDEDTAQKIIGKMSAEVDLVISSRRATEHNH